MSEESSVRLVRTSIKQESDIVFLRQRIRMVAHALGFETQDQTRIATSVSELARNAFQYASGGIAEIFISETKGKQKLVISVTDSGPGIPNLEQILAGNYRSKTGMGLGITGTRKLMDELLIETSAAGTKVIIEKWFPEGIPRADSAVLATVNEVLAKAIAENPYREIQEQNQELHAALASLSEKKAELAILNQELTSSNRAMAALYAELDEKAASLKRISETKTSFMANMTHEFRTPVNSILNLSHFLLDPNEGVKDAEHRIQVQFIEKSAQTLSDFVNDLLDLSKVEAGKVVLRPSCVSVAQVLDTVQGMTKPLLLQKLQVRLIFVPAPEIELFIDEGKLSQILRNLISNALKYTEAGTVTVSAECSKPGFITFKVLDTGIGIEPADHERIFDEFAQIDSVLQRRVKGTGLGLPLTLRLTHLLGGTLTVESVPGQGSSFAVQMPVKFSGKEEGLLVAETKIKVPLAESVDPALNNLVLIIDDDGAARYTLIQLLKEFHVGAVPAENGQKGIALARELLPKLIVLDLSMPDMTGFEVLKNLMSHPATSVIPVLISSSQELSSEEFNYLNEVTWGFVPKYRILEPMEKDVLKGLIRKAGLSKND